MFSLTLSLEHQSNELISGLNTHILCIETVTGISAPLTFDFNVISQLSNYFTQCYPLSSLSSHFFLYFPLNYHQWRKILIDISFISTIRQQFLVQPMFI